MREAFIGFDSAWAGKVPGGIVWATFEDQHLAAFAEPRLAGFKDAAQIIETLRSECDYVLRGGPRNSDRLLRWIPTSEWRDRNHAETEKIPR